MILRKVNHHTVLFISRSMPMTALNITISSITNYQPLAWLVLARGPGNLPTVQVRKAKQFSWVPDPSKILTHRPLVGETLTSTCKPAGFAGLGLTCRFQSLVLLFQFFYIWSHSDILLLTAKYWLWYVIVIFWCIGRLYNQKRETHSLPHHENERHWSVKDIWSRIFGNLSGDWVQTFINEVLATFVGKLACNTLPAPFGKWVSTECQRFLVL